MSEQQVIAALKKLEKGWPENLWIFCNGQGVYLMRNKEGQRAMTPDGSVDPNYVVERFFIESDGGDW